MHMTFEYRKSCGKDLYYPTNSTSRFICDLMGKGNLLHRHLKKMIDYGWNVTIETPNVSMLLEAE